MRDENMIYIVAGDEMLKLMKRLYPDRRTVPFREDLSKGSCSGFCFDAGFIKHRASFWGISQEEYDAKMSPIINLDMKKDYTLCFGNDDCCAANLKFMIGYLKSKGYPSAINVMIVDEYDLTVLEEYSIQP